MKHPLGITAVCAGVVFAFIYLLNYCQRKGSTWDFDVGGKQGAFEQHAKRYQKLASLIITLATAAVAFFVNFLVTLPPEPKGRSVYNIRMEGAAPWVISLLSLSIMCGLLFVLFEDLFYEDYCHAKYPRAGVQPRETYTASRYALNLSFAWMALLLFFGAFLYLASKVL